MDIELRANRPFRVGFLLVDGFALLSYASAAEPLRAANSLANETLYNVRQVPVFSAQAISSGKATIPANAQVGEQVDFDLVLVVAGDNALQFSTERVFHWLRNLARRGTVLGGISGGAVLLARAGLMADRRMTAHWEHTESLTELLPDLIIERGLYVIDRDRLTCAGGTAALDMMHALIAIQHGDQFARLVSDQFLHTDVRSGEGPQRAGLVERYATNNKAVVQTIKLMDETLADPLSLPQLAAQVQLGARQLNRVFRQQIGLSTMEFYRKLRLKKALSLLTHTTLPMTEIALATGFGSSAHFSSAFRQWYGKPPSSIRST